MNINWKVRLRNPVWYAEIAAAIILPMAAAVGLGWKDMTSWPALFEVIKAAAENPVTIAAVVVSVWNAVTDPTTKGFGDSERALGYEHPGGESGVQREETLK